MVFTKKTISEVIDEILNHNKESETGKLKNSQAAIQAKKEIKKKIELDYGELFRVFFVTEDQKAANKKKIYKPKGEPPKGKNLTILEKSKRIFKKTDMQQKTEEYNKELEKSKKNIAEMDNLHNKINETYENIKEKIKNLLEMKIKKK